MDAKEALGILLAERDALKAEVDKLITEVSHLQHDLFYEEQAKLKAEATLIEARPLLEAVKRASLKFWTLVAGICVKNGWIKPKSRRAKSARQEKTRRGK